METRSVAQRAYPWITPKIFPDFAPQTVRTVVRGFFDHYSEWFGAVEEVVVFFCTGNVDHIFNYAGVGASSPAFDWARYNSYVGAPGRVQEHNRDWLARVREGGERSGNPYLAGPSVVIRDSTLTHESLSFIYQSFREEARSRGITLFLTEYLEPGAEFCYSEWKSVRHPEASRTLQNAGGDTARLLDVCASLHADSYRYAAFPQGVPDGLPLSTFIGRQTAAYMADFHLDGILLGNQFGLAGLWGPQFAVEPTRARRAGISKFFRDLRTALGSARIYWQDSFWPAEVENSAWGMERSSYALLDGIICSNFGVLVERTNIRPNVESKVAIRNSSAPGTDVIFSMDFVDPWYWYRIHLDDRYNYAFQRDVYAALRDCINGISFFANDTFGHFVPTGPLNETIRLLKKAPQDVPLPSQS